MKKINGDISKSIKYYIPCTLSFINENVKRSGYESRLSLILSTRLLGIPYFVNNPMTNEIKYRFFGSDLLGYKYYSEYMKLIFKYSQFDTFDKGISYISNMVDLNKISITYGTPYHLPYSAHYHSSEFAEFYGKELGIYDHALGICGIGEEEVLVYDTTPNVVIDKVSMNDFKNFWRGNNYIKGFEEISKKMNFMTFGYLDVEIKEKLKSDDVDTLIERGLRTVAYEYLQGSELNIDNFTYSFGFKSVDRFVENISMIEDFSDFELVSSRIRMLFEMRFTRYFYRDILLDMMQNSRKKSFYKEYYNRFSEIISDLEEIGTFYTLKASSRRILSDDIKNIINKLKSIQNKEKLFYQSFLQYNDILDYLEKSDK